MAQRRADLLSIFLVSAGTLAFEVVLTRVFAITFWHHFASLLIALALTGFGAAGSLLVPLLPRLERHQRRALALSALAAALAMPVFYLAALAVGLEPLSLGWSLGAWLDLALVCLLLLVPFLLAASHVALVLAWTPAPGRAYAANLAGSGLGCLAAAVSLAWLLPNQALYPAAALVLAGFAVQSLGLARGPVLSLWALAAVLAALLAMHPLPLRYEAFKDRSAALAARGARLEQRAVGLWGVVEVISGPAFHFAPGLSLSCAHPLPGQKGLFVDGDLRGPVSSASREQAAPAFASCLLISLPFEVLGPHSALIVNPGGGLAVLAAAGQGVRRVTVLEDSPQVLTLLRGPLAAFSGDLYRRPGLTVHRVDPARFLGQDGGSFDLIVLGDGTRWEAGSASGLGVSRLLTVEGLAALLRRLSPGGALVLAGPLLRPPRASLKLIATAARALRRLGADPAASLAVLRDWSAALILLRPAGLGPGQARALRQAAWQRGFDLSYLPGLRPDDLNRFHRLAGEPLARAARLAVAGREAELRESSPFDLRPATRDRPYFFSFFRSSTLRLILDRGPGRALAVTQWGLLFTWGGLIVTLLAAAAGILLPLRGLRPRPRGLAFFGLIGLAYMLAEVTLLAEAIHRLGRPALAIPLVVGVFLVVSGVGSLLWGQRRPGWFALAAAVCLPLALLGLRYLPGGEWVAALSLAPAALFMGAPFAGGLTHLAGPRPAARAWAFGVNGFCSVAGSLAATLIALQAGHLTAILAAVACYLLAAASARGGAR